MEQVKVQCDTTTKRKPVGIRATFRCDKKHKNNKVLLYSSGNYIPYLVINHNGKEYEKECIYE